MPIDKALLVETAQRLIRINSSNPPGNEELVAGILAERLRAAGLEVQFLEAAAGRPNLLALWRGEGKRTLVLHGHMDTTPAVPEGWKYQPFAAKVDGDKLYGRGAADMKGGLAAMVAAIESLKREGWQPKGNLVFLGAVNEEMGDKEGIGMRFAAPRLSKMFQGEKLIIMTDTTDMNVVIAEKGVLWLEITANGKEAHGSMPWQGVNAIEKLGKFLLALRELERPTAHRLLGKGTASVNTISGGYKTNVVPASAKASVDIRLVPGESKESVMNAVSMLLKKLKAADPDMDISMREILYYEPIEVQAGKPFVADMAAAIRKASGREPDIKGEHGASGAGIFMREGFDILMCGPGKPELAHTRDEWVSLEQLVQAAEAYSDFAKKWLG